MNKPMEMLGIWLAKLRLQLGDPLFASHWLRGVCAQLFMRPAPAAGR